MKILYVEDNEDNVYMLKNRLTRAGFTVIVATDGAEGVALASSEKPDLILMDLTLPNMDGEEATRRIKADSATNRIPVIALTANAMAGDREKALLRLHGREHLVAVHVRHHDVEQHEVERSGIEQLQGLPAVSGGSDVQIALAGEPSA